MRIALFAWESIHSISVGGVAFHVTELACALERKGHKVHVFTRLGRPDQKWYERIHGVHYHFCPFSPDLNFVEEINNMCRSFVDAFFQTEEHIGKFDIIHAHDWLTSNVIVWIKEERKHKAVLTIHSTEYGRCGNNFFEGNSARIRENERIGVHCADRVITVSRALKNEVMWMYGVKEDKVSVVYNGVNYRNFDGWIDPVAVRRMYGIGAMDPVVLFVGRIVYQKGPDLLIDAIPHILKYYDNAKFVFVGDGEMKSDIEDQARRVGVSHSTRFLGYLSGWRLIDLYKASDAVCIPSRNEPFGIVILEAWSAGKPVIASLNGGPGEIIWHEINGLKVYPNPDSVAWGIGTAFEDFDYASWMGRMGRVAVESAFSWNATADHVLSLYYN
ncbi:MAG: glycosyltransferase [Candidatus Omnitrophica bacterium]|nr:glycosyltransferase [Candidatus Omnitrophota bacterium]MBD3268962.1 glycosyltransferase [Candidatus Omnitrophota bacterium]